MRKFEDYMDEKYPTYPTFIPLYPTTPILIGDKTNDSTY
jgi:hypothetical protein